MNFQGLASSQNFGIRPAKSVTREGHASIHLISQQRPFETVMADGEEECSFLN